MKSICRYSFAAATYLVLLVGASESSAQLFREHMQPAGNSGSAVSTSAAQPDSLPASPLAGGQAAAYGDSFVDAHGSAITMPASYGATPASYGEVPASYCQTCPPEYGGDGGYCSPYGDSAYVDFGGYSSDQSGPHYFDIMAGTVWLKSEDAFEGVGAFGSIGVDGPRVLDPAVSSDDYEPGWQIAARVDLGPLSVLEAAYMGLYDIGFSETVRSVDVVPGNQDFQLFSAPGYGLPAPVAGLDDGSIYSLGYDADLQSTEFTYRRYWLGTMPRVTGTYLLGFRYVRLTEDLNFDATVLADPVLLTTDTTSIAWLGDNDLLGFQLGGDGWITIRQGLRLGAEGKAGLYNNRFVFRNAANFAAVAGAPTDFDVTTKGNEVAFVGEGSASIVADILPSISIRGGYRVLYIDRVASIGSNLNMANLTTQVVGVPGGDALYHGFDASIEYVW